MHSNGYSDADVARVRVALLRRAGRPLDSNEQPYDAWGDVMKAEESYFDQLARAALDAMTASSHGWRCVFANTRSGVAPLDLCTCEPDGPDAIRHDAGCPCRAALPGAEAESPSVGTDLRPAHDGWMPGDGLFAPPKGGRPIV